MSHDDENGGDEEFRLPPPTRDFYRSFVMRQIVDINRKLDREFNSIDKRFDGLDKKYVSSERFDAIVGPIQRVLWLIFSVITSGLVLAVLGLLIRGKDLVK